jgi:glycine cleavage system H protein
MKFTESHEWIDIQNDIGVVGITQYAQKELGDIVYVELPKVGNNVNAGEEAAVLESTKAAADVYSPVSGTILEINDALLNTSNLINKFPETKGWLFKIKINNPAELEALLDVKSYQALVSH